MIRERQKHLLEIIRQEGVIRPRDMDKYQIPRGYLHQLHNAGLVSRVAEASKSIPNGVICLLSALRFHELTTQAPFEVWIALDPKMWHPQIESLPIHIVRFSGRAFDRGIEEHTIDGVSVRTYDPAKTVVDCFRYRNKIGLDVALEALRDYLSHREKRSNEQYSVDKLWEYAQQCRMSRVMMPYMEAMI